MVLGHPEGSFPLSSMTNSLQRMLHALSALWEHFEQSEDMVPCAFLGGSERAHKQSN
jgi:hypothetical protein